MFVCFCVVSAGQVWAQTTSPVSKLTPRPAPGTLSEADIAALKTELVDEKKGTTLKFSASFSQLGLDPKRDKSKISKYAKSGQVPFRIITTLTEYKEVKGRKLSELQSGTCRIYILDSEGKVVDKTTQSLTKMCPS